MKIDQIKIKQFGKAAVMFRAINAAGEVVQVFETRKEAWVAAKSAACGGLQSPSGGLPWNA
jgi:transposase-like protein